MEIDLPLISRTLLINFPRKGTEKVCESESFVPQRAFRIRSTFASMYCQCPSFFLFFSGRWNGCRILWATGGRKGEWDGLGIRDSPFIAQEQNQCFGPVGHVIRIAPFRKCKWKICFWKHFGVKMQYWIHFHLNSATQKAITRRSWLPGSPVPDSSAPQFSSSSAPIRFHAERPWNKNWNNFLCKTGLSCSAQRRRCSKGH